MSAITVTTLPDNSGGAFVFQIDSLTVSPSMPPNYWTITVPNGGWTETSTNTFEWVGDLLQDLGGEPPSGCGIGLTVSPCFITDLPPYVPPHSGGSSVPAPGTALLMGAALLCAGAVSRLKR